jgi:hypothetical protein
MSIPTIADVVETMSPKAITKRVCRQLITARLSRDLLRQVRSFAIDSGGWNDNEQGKQRCPLITGASMRTGVWTIAAPLRCPSTQVTR